MTDETKEFLDKAHTEAEKDVILMQVYHFIEANNLDDSIMEIKRFSEQKDDYCPVYFT